MVCGGRYSTNGNIIKHIKNLHSDVIYSSKKKALIPKDERETPFTYITKSGKSKPVLRATLKAIEWKVRHGVSMESLCDKEYKEEIFRFPEAIKCPETMRKIMNCIAEQTLKFNIEALQNL